MTKIKCLYVEIAINVIIVFAQNQIFKVHGVRNARNFAICVTINSLEIMKPSATIVLTAKRIL